MWYRINNMSEIYTPHPEHVENNSEINNEPISSDPSEGNPFVTGAGIPSAEVPEFDISDAAGRAQQLFEIPQQTTDTPTPEEPTVKQGWSTRQKVGTVIAIGAGIAGVNVADYIAPGQEIAAATSTVQAGKGIEQAVDRDIKQIELQKIDPADPNERSDVISQAIEIHTDINGIVQPGENITVVAEKSPIFGNITYEAVPTETTVTNATEASVIPKIEESVTPSIGEPDIQLPTE